MTIPSGPITIEISEMEPVTIEITQAPSPEFSISEIGPQGPPGTDGINGTPGAKWYQGSSAPSSATGIVGDFYINTTSYDVYEKTDSVTWTVRLNIKGAVGLQGIQGIQGVKGDTGDTGSAGPSNTLSIGTVTTGLAGSSASASITGTSPSQTLNLTIPTGNTGASGAVGPANTLSIGTVNTGTAGSSASASITGTAPTQTLSLTIPRGDTGATGATGTNNTTIVRKIADETVTSSTTVQDDDHLVIALAANSVYAFDSFIMFDCDATADIKFTFTGPASSTISFTSDGVSAGNSNNIGSIKMDVNAAGIETVLGGFIGTKTAIRPAGVIVTGATAGNLTFRWAQNITSGTPTTVYTNSWLRAQKV